MSILTFVIAIVVMTALTLIGFGIYYYFHRGMDNPDADAIVTGPCGDTMQIALKFNESRVEDIYCWTNGCTISKMCVETAASLARGKTLPELKQIDMAAIMERTGKLPDTHIHCAQLAAMTLQRAIENYKLKTS